MASISDVENAIANLIGGVIAPGGVSALGYPILIYPGWPDSATLDVDMVETAPATPTAAHVSIYPLPAERNVTRYQNIEQEKPLPAATYTLSVAGQVVTVGGAAPSPYAIQNLALVVNGFTYAVQAAAGQTPAQLATAMQSALSLGIAGVTVAGAVLTLPAGANITMAVVGVTGSTIREVRRQEKQFQVSVWSSHPISRAAIADAFDPILADTPFLSMPDGTRARLKYMATREDDFTQKQRIYRRSLIFTVEYATTLTLSATQIVGFGINYRDADGNIIVSIPRAPVAVGAGGILDFSLIGGDNTDLLPGL